MTKRMKLLIVFAILILVFPYQAMAYKIVIDAGHGGKDPGATGVGGLKEKDVNLDISLKLGGILRGQGHDVVYTREDDTYLSLAERVDFTNQQNADLFVSIHANSFNTPAMNGSMVLYYDDSYPQEDYPASGAMRALTPYSKQLAQGVLDSLVQAAGTANLGLSPSAVYVARMGTIPSILVETAFLSSQKDAALLASDAVRNQMAEGIAKGIAAFEPPVFVDTIGHWARESIMRIKNKGWIEGINNRYQPDRALTRAEFVTLMDRMFDFDALLKACESTGASANVTNAVYGCKDTVKPSSDMSSAHWAYPVMTKALRLNLLQGYEDGTVRPDKSITRAEVAVLFQRLLAATNPVHRPRNEPLKESFTDVPGSLWSAEAIYALQSKGIINGVTDTLFMPDRSITRAEIAVMMDRYQ